jgi:ATP-dependent DNA helicase PIF1
VGKTKSIEVAYEMYKNKKKIIKTAMTGSAAVLINGCTLHSWCGLGLKINDNYKIDYLIKYLNKPKNKEKLTNWLITDILIIDECSMLSVDMLNKIDKIARIVRNKPDLPYGGLIIILVGDLLQLACIGSTKLLFESKSWKNFKIVYLNKIIRQNNKDFINGLNDIRMGFISNKTKKLFRKCVNKVLPIKNNIYPIRMFSLRKNMIYYNNSKFEQLVTENNFEIKSYKTLWSPTKDKYSDFSVYLRNIPLNHILLLCEQARVMLLKNLDIEKGLINGSQGIIIGFENNLPIVEFKNNVKKIIHPTEYEIIENKEKIGIFTALPLTLAYGISIHKTQGMTLDQAVIDLSNIFEANQAYVALSRVRTIEGLSIIGLDFKKCLINKKAIEFYKNLEKNLKEKKRLRKEKKLKNKI